MDDFITVGAPGTSECEMNLGLLKQICEEAGMPTVPEKEEGLATTLVFLGMELDSTARQIRLPQDKLHNLNAMLQEMRGMKACRKR